MQSRPFFVCEIAAGNGRNGSQCDMRRESIAEFAEPFNARGNQTAPAGPPLVDRGPAALPFNRKTLFRSFPYCVGTERVGQRKRLIKLNIYFPNRKSGGAYENLRPRDHT